MYFYRIGKSFLSCHHTRIVITDGIFNFLLTALVGCIMSCDRIPEHLLVFF